jgi:Holliday junction resolvase RusA-like endonuclease
MFSTTQFPKDRQEYRRKNRGVQTKRSPGRKPKSKAATPLKPQSETRKELKGQLFILS